MYGSETATSTTDENEDSSAERTNMQLTNAQRKLGAVTYSWRQHVMDAELRMDRIKRFGARANRGATWTPFRWMTTSGNNRWMPWRRECPQAPQRKWSINAVPCRCQDTRGVQCDESILWHHGNGLTSGGYEDFSDVPMTAPKKYHGRTATDNLVRVHGSRTR